MKIFTGIFSLILTGLLLATPAWANDLDDMENLDEIGVGIETEAIMQDAEAAEDIAEENKKQRVETERNARKAKAKALRQQDQYKIKRQAAETQIAMDEAAIEKARAQIAEAKAKITKMNQETQVLQEKKENTRGKLNELKQRYAEARKELAARSKEYQNLNDGMRKANKATQVTAKKIENTKKKLAVLYTKLKNARTKNYAGHQRNTKLIELYRQQIATAQTRLDQLEMRLNAQLDQLGQ